MFAAKNFPKPRILISRPTFAEVIAELRERYEVEDSQREDLTGNPDELRRRLADKDGALLAGADRIDVAALDGAPRLKAVCNIAVGYNNLDIAACTARGVAATNTPGVLDDTTADIAWALLMAAARRIAEGDRYVRAGRWTSIMKYNDFLGADIHHATLGVIGLGRIGQAVARRARGFSMKVVYYNRHRVAPAIEKELGAKYVPLDRLLATSDFVSLNVPYAKETHHLIGAKELAKMKSTAVLINSARGGIVDDAALIEALKAGKIAAAGLDVYEGEPKLNPGFLTLENVVLSPHIGSASQATRMKMVRLAVKNLTAILSGKRPLNLLNPEVWANRKKY